MPSAAGVGEGGHHREPWAQWLRGGRVAPWALQAALAVWIVSSLKGRTAALWKVALRDQIGRFGSAVREPRAWETLVASRWRRRSPHIGQVWRVLSPRPGRGRDGGPLQDRGLGHVAKGDEDAAGP